MGSLINRKISSLFGGVSRQPQDIRRENQVQDADNVLFDIKTGGAEGRPGMSMVAATGLDATKNFFVHHIDRGDGVRFVVLIDNDGAVSVFNADTGAAQTVTGSTSYLVAEPEDLTAVTIADTTLVANRTVVVTKNAGVTALGTFKGNVTAVSDLPSSPAADDVYRITNSVSSLDDYYMRWDASQSAWVEGANPGESVAFDEATMPHRIVRNSDGTWTVESVPWDDREVGDLESVPDPSFVGRTIQDLTYFKSRLGVISRDKIYFSQANDLFNFFPDSANLVIESDPADASASATDPVNLQWVVPFRRSLFFVSELAQFELVSGPIITPTGVALDPATAYKATSLCRPVVLGSELYFPGVRQGNAVLYEYYYEEESISNTATDVTQHAEGYVPGTIALLTASSVADAVAMVADGDNSSIYVYKSYWAGNEKIMSSWARWTFPGSFFSGMKAINDTLYCVMKRDGQVLLTTIPLVREAREQNMPFDIKLDYRERVTGTYDAGTNQTTWTVGSHKTSPCTVVLDGSWPLERRGLKLSNVTVPTSTTVSAPGDWSAHPVLIGQEFVQSLPLSTIYARDEAGMPVTNGRLQLKDITINHGPSSYFEVVVTPDRRTPRRTIMSGRSVGSLSSIIGRVTTLAGRLRVPIRSRNTQVSIAVVNPTYLPWEVYSIDWRGFYNELSMQD